MFSASHTGLSLSYFSLGAVNNVRMGTAPS